MLANPDGMRCPTRWHCDRCEDVRSCMDGEARARLKRVRDRTPESKEEVYRSHEFIGHDGVGRLLVFQPSLLVHHYVFDGLLIRQQAKDEIKSETDSLFTKEIDSTTHVCYHRDLAPALL